MPVAALTLVVLAYRCVTNPGTGIATLVAIGALVLVAVAFFSRAEITVGDQMLTYRRLLWRRRFPLQSIGGLALRRISLVTNYYAHGPTSFAIVYDDHRHALFSLSAALWSDGDLRALQHAIGGNSSHDPVGARELQSEFPGALPGWLVFYEAHPFWGIAIGTVVVFAAIVAALALTDAVKPR